MKSEPESRFEKGVDVKVRIFAFNMPHDDFKASVSCYLLNLLEFPLIKTCEETLTQANKLYK